jgi:hypothetical protein
MTPEELIRELQMQNAESKRARIALEESRDRYAALYDFAPVGYRELISAKFRRFVAAEDQEQWDLHIASVLTQRTKRSCDLMLEREDGST